MDLNAHIQTVRKLKPFLDAAASLLEVGENLQKAEHQLSAAEAGRLAAQKDAVDAQARAGRFADDAAETVTKASHEAKVISERAESLLADARVKAARLLFDTDAEIAIDKAEAQKQLTEKQALLAAVVKTLSDKAGEIAALDGRIASAREAMRKLLA